jgi:toxin ParE1/3/4
VANVIQSLPAEADLNAIVDYIAADNLPAALDWLMAIRQLFELLSKQPLIGERQITLRHGEVRRICHGRYVVYYLPIRDGVEILRVIHGAREHDNLL